MQVFMYKVNMKDFIKTKLRENIDNLEGYHNWLNSNSKKVEIHNTKEILKVDISLMQRDFDAYLKDNVNYKYVQKQTRNILENEINPNECFHNAGLVFQSFMNTHNIEVEYVLGLMTQHGKSFGHAWNRINGVHYDFTAEKMHETTSTYTQIVVFNDLNTIESLPMFNPNGECSHSLNVNGESYDLNGMCSLYPYYKSLT